MVAMDEERETHLLCHFSSYLEEMKSSCGGPLEILGCLFLTGSFDNFVCVVSLNGFVALLLVAVDEERELHLLG